MFLVQMTKVLNNDDPSLSSQLCQLQVVRCEVGFDRKGWSSVKPVQRWWHYDTSQKVISSPRLANWWRNLILCHRNLRWGLLLTLFGVCSFLPHSECWHFNVLISLFCDWLVRWGHAGKSTSRQHIQYKHIHYVILQLVLCDFDVLKHC